MLLMQRRCTGNVPIVAFTKLRDNGGLLYPSGPLFWFVKNLENLFTSFFSSKQLHRESILDVLALIRSTPQQSVCCSIHNKRLTAEITAFYLTTRLHFFVKPVNKSRATKRDAAKYIKLSRCT
ncbi:unnamed protein product [Ixodes pacificus]